MIFFMDGPVKLKCGGTGSKMKLIRAVPTKIFCLLFKQ